MQDFLVKKGMELLNTDKLEVCWPMIDFLTPWIAANQKQLEVKPEALQIMVQMLEVVIRRVAYPEWCEVDVEPDDSQAEYNSVRELLKIVYINLTLIKPLHEHLLTRVAQEIDSVNLQQISVKKAEVSIFLVHELFKCIPLHARQRQTGNGPYVMLVTKLLNVDFLAYDNHLTTTEYFECIVQYSGFFKDDEQFFATVIQKFFSPQGIVNPRKAVASNATYEFMKLTDKFKFCSSFNQHYEVILDNAVKVIQACANGQISEESLGHEEVRYLYGILSVITADN